MIDFENLLNILNNDRGYFSSDETDPLFETLISSINNTQFKNKPNKVIHTGFYVHDWHSSTVEILYDNRSGKVINQILDPYFYKRFLGQEMYLVNGKYSPFYDCDGKKAQIKIFRKLHESKYFCHPISFVVKLQNIPKKSFALEVLTNPDCQLDFEFLTNDYYKGIQDTLDKFTVSFDLGNDVIELVKNWKYYNPIFNRTFSLDRISDPNFLKFNRNRTKKFKATPRNLWDNNSDGYCGACMMNPCHCSDPDPG